MPLASGSPAPVRRLRRPGPPQKTPGLINTKINTKNPLQSISGYDPEKITLDPKTDTVAGQIDSIVKRDSPLMQSARTRSQQAMQRRGIVNSTMAGQAGEQAVIDTALPIAQQDASQYYDANRTNAAAGNRAFEFTADATNRGALQERAGQIETGLIGESGKQERLNIGSRTESESRLITERGDIDKQLINATGDMRDRLLVRQGDIDKELTRVRGAEERTTIGTRTDAESRLLTEKGDIDERIVNAEGAVRENLIKEQGRIDRELTTMRLQTEMDIQGLRGEQANELADIQGRYNTLMQANASAATFFSNISSAIGDILSNNEIPASAKQGLINSEIQLLQSGLVVMGATADLDFEGLLDFSTGGGTTTGGNIGAGNTGGYGSYGGYGAGSNTGIGVTPAPQPEPNQPAGTLSDFVQSMVPADRSTANIPGVPDSVNAVLRGTAGMTPEAEAWFRQQWQGNQP